MRNDVFVDYDQAMHLVRSAMNAVLNLRDADFWRIKGEDLLTLGLQLETLTRTVCAVDVHLAGDVQAQGLATNRGSSSTAVLLRPGPGGTNVATGVLLCGFHHQGNQQRAWVIQFADDGRPEMIPPICIDKNQKPRRKEMHHLRELVDTSWGE